MRCSRALIETPRTECAVYNDRHAAYNFWFAGGPHRLEAQDTALSRRRQGFESPWGYSIRHDNGHLLDASRALEQMSDREDQDGRD